jgi:hypothetical protein
MKFTLRGTPISSSYYFIRHREKIENLSIMKSHQNGDSCE